MKTGSSSISGSLKIHFSDLDFLKDATCRDDCQSKCTDESSIHYIETDHNHFPIYFFSDLQKIYYNLFVEIFFNDLQ